MKNNGINKHLVRKIVRENIEKHMTNEDIEFNKQRFFNILKGMGVAAATAASLWAIANGGGPDNVEDPSKSDPEGSAEMHRYHIVPGDEYDTIYQMEQKKNFKKIVESCVSRILKKRLNEDEARWMNDDEINSQYAGMEITAFDLEPLSTSEGWQGRFELSFPNADGIDYDETMVNNFFVYDEMGNDIAWDNWMPDEQTRYLEDVIRQEIRKKIGA